MKAEYDNFAPFYDLEYGHKENDLDFYLDVADQYGDSVLEIGVGTGRVALELAFEGFQVTGIDNSAKMLQVAEKNLETLPQENRQWVKFVHADMRNFDLKIRFPLCIIPFRAFLHNLTQQDQLDTLACIYKHLQPGGIVALDLFVPLYHLFSQNEWQDKVAEEELAEENSQTSIDIHVSHNPAEQLVEIINTYHQADSESIAAKMHYRYVFRNEMEALLKLSGFEIIDVAGGFDGQPYDYYSGIMTFIAKKQG